MACLMTAPVMGSIFEIAARRRGCDRQVFFVGHFDQRRNRGRRRRTQVAERRDRGQSNGRGLSRPHPIQQRPEPGRGRLTINLHQGVDGSSRDFEIPGSGCLEQRRNG